MLAMKLLMNLGDEAVADGTGSNAFFHDGPIVPVYDDSATALIGASFC